MSPTGQGSLAAVYDVTFCEGAGGYIQMDVMGEALAINQQQLMKLGEREAELSGAEVRAVIQEVCDVAAGFVGWLKWLCGKYFTRYAKDYFGMD